jgi:hypothetical protein
MVDKPLAGPVGYVLSRAILVDGSLGALLCDLRTLDDSRRVGVSMTFDDIVIPGQ